MMLLYGKQANASFHLPVQFGARKVTTAEEGEASTLQ
jgi:hypothetical protein